MSTTPAETTRFSQLLDDALHGAKMRQDQLALRLGELESIALTSSAISMWRKRGVPPEAWQRHLVTVFGANSTIGMALLRGDFVQQPAPPAWLKQPVSDGRTDATAPTPPGSEARPPTPEISPDGVYVARWLDKIPDQEVKERLAHQCVGLILRVLDGPAPEPTQERAALTETPGAQLQAN